MYIIKRGDEVLVATDKIHDMCDVLMKYINSHIDYDLLDDVYLELVQMFDYHIKGILENRFLIYRHIFEIARKYGLTIEEVRE